MGRYIGRDGAGLGIGGASLLPLALAVLCVLVLVLLEERLDARVAGVDARQRREHLG